MNIIGKQLEIFFLMFLIKLGFFSYRSATYAFLLSVF